MNELKRRGIVLHTWSVLGAFLLASMFMPPPSLAPEADAPLAIDDAGADTSVFKGYPDAPAARLAPPPPPQPTLQSGGRAPWITDRPDVSREIETALPPRAPPG